MNLKTRVDKLEAAIGGKSDANFCVVLHSENVDCKESRDKAIKSFVALNGVQPKKFFNILMVGMGREPTCGCTAEDLA